jgi:hypothetical protein
MDPAQEVAKILFAVANLFALPFEKNFTPDKYLSFAQNNGFIPITLVVFYLLFCYFGSKMMKNREPFDLRIPLAAWNAALSLFSFIGMFRTVPYLVATILSRPYEKTICGHPLDPEGILN